MYHFLSSLLVEVYQGITDMLVCRNRDLLLFLCDMKHGEPGLLVDMNFLYALLECYLGLTLGNEREHHSIDPDYLLEAKLGRNNQVPGKLNPLL